MDGGDHGWRFAHPGRIDKGGLSARYSLNRRIHSRSPPPVLPVMNTCGKFLKEAGFMMCCRRQRPLVGRRGQTKRVLPSTSAVGRRLISFWSCCLAPLFRQLTAIREMPARDNSPRMPNESGPPMPLPVGGNWDLSGKKQVRHVPGEVDLRNLQPGDRLEVVTKNTRYEFVWREDDQALLRTDRTDRPWGLVTLTGCAFAGSGIVAPKVVFRGGKLEFISTDGQVRHQTTTIVSLTLHRGEHRDEPRRPD
jgi:hypothetical protein